jgi:hypothetical protein
MNVDEMLESARDAINVRRVYGGGGGFGLQARPVGAFVIRAERSNGVLRST